MRVIYTDASYKEGAAGIVVVCASVDFWVVHADRIQIGNSIDAEVAAIHKAEQIYAGNKEIYTDSKRALKIAKDTLKRGSLKWIPAHAGLPGNALADRFARRALEEGEFQRLFMLEAELGDSIENAAFRAFLDYPGGGTQRVFVSHFSGSNALVRINRKGVLGKTVKRVPRSWLRRY